LEISLTFLGVFAEIEGSNFIKLAGLLIGFLLLEDFLVS